MLKAMLALQHAQFDLGSFQPLLTVLSNAGINKPLNLFGMFEFRHLTASWRFDGRQQDAAEYLTNILQHPSGSLRQVQWQARTDDKRKVLIQASLLCSYACPPLQLRYKTASTCGVNTRSSEQCAGNRSCFRSCCAQTGHKSQAAISWQLPVQVPIWQQGQNRRTVPYRVISGVAHRGSQLGSSSLKLDKANVSAGYSPAGMAY